MAFSAVNPVSVGDPTRKSDFDRVFDNTLALQDGSASLDAVDIVTGATTSSGFHMGEVAGEGGWLTSEDDTSLQISAGAERVSGAWIARATESARLALVTSGVRFFYDTSLTDGNSFTPTERMAVTTATLNIKSLYLGMTEISDPGVSAAGTCWLFTYDDGGKTTLAARFPSGGVIDIAAEP